MTAALLAASLAGFVPPLSEAVVYEANLRAEGPTGGFVALTKRLDSIRSLGVNVLWLMPVQPVGKVRSAGGLGSPYAVADFDAVNPEFGSTAELRRLIAEAHRRKMAVLLDWVANHTAWDNPWLTAHPDWYTRDAKGEITIPTGTNWNDVADLDYSKPALRAAMVASMRGWAKRFGIDGFRCDTADFVPYDFWKEAIPKIRQGRSLLMLAEGFRADHYAAGFDLTFGWPFYDRLCAIYKGAKASELAGASANEAKGVPAGARRLRFVTNHDKAAWEGTTLDFFKTREGVRGAFAVTALYGGTPLIYSGQEVAWAKRVPIFERSAIGWASDPETGPWIGALMGLRKAHPAFRDGTTVDVSTDDVIAFRRRLGADEGMVLANVRDRATQIGVPSGEWRDGFTRKVSRLLEKIKLPPYGFRIFVRP